MQGRHRLPTELKALKGTINTTREKQHPAPDVILAETDIIIPNGTKIQCPKSIKTRYVKKYWKEVIKNLEILHLLSRTDIPQIENLCVTLEKLLEVQAVFVDMDVMDEEFDIVEKRFTRLSTKFDTLATKYYISPQSRMQLKLEGLSAIKQEQEIKKNDNAIGNILNMRRDSD